MQHIYENRVICTINLSVWEYVSHVRTAIFAVHARDCFRVSRVERLHHHELALVRLHQQEMQYGTQIYLHTSARGS